MISILPGLPWEWKSSASLSENLMLLSDMAVGLSHFVSPAKAEDPLRRLTLPQEKQQCRMLRE
jgi:hypothetical protein